MTLKEFNQYMNKKFDEMIEKLCPQQKNNTKSKK